MKIDITKDEYRVLLDVIEIADWMLHSHKTDEDPETKHFRALFKKFYSYAKEAGFGDFVEYDDSEGEYYPTQKFEEDSNAMDFIEEYDDDTFWSELTDRLTSRDLTDELSIEKIEAMDTQQRFEKISALNDNYNEEFEEYGIDRLYIRK